MRTLGATLGSFGAILGANLVPSWAILWVIMSPISKCLIRRRLRLRFLLLFVYLLLLGVFLLHASPSAEAFAYVYLHILAHLRHALPFLEEAFASVHVRILML